MSPPPGAGRTTIEARDGQAGIRLRTAPRKDAGRSPASRLFLLLLGILGVLVFVGLGIWQLERRVWKLDLIARVDQRIHAPVVDAPGPVGWNGLTAVGSEYSHVRLAGRFLGGASTLVQAVTELGGGYWVLTPMRTDRGFVVLVNRGFVPVERKAEFERESGDGFTAPVVIDGLLRMSEPGGGFLRKNDVADNRWYSRDVAAIATARGLTDVAPYFVDVGASGTDGWPRGGLTVVNFRNSHLVYALTWFTLAAMLAVAQAAPMWPLAARTGKMSIPPQVLGNDKSFAAASFAGKVGAVADPDAANRKNLLLLIQLRWLAVAGQVLTILVTEYWFAIPLPLPEMAGVVLFLVGLNIFSLLVLRGQRPISNAQLFVALIFDMAALTIQLYLSGGASNPFVSLYLLQITLGAALLTPWSTWILVVAASACFVFLIFQFLPIAIPHHGGSDLLALHLRGMFICFVLAAGLIVIFMTRINRNLRERDAYLADLRQRSAEEDHIVRMGLLASGAAHELGTPLSTISVILSDWRQMRSVTRNRELAGDVAEMQAQIERCKSIVSGILMSSGQARGEGTIRTSIRHFLDDLVQEWRVSRQPLNLDYRNDFEPDEQIVSDTALKQVVFNVFDNAQEASQDWVGVTAERQGEKLMITVRDHGPGFDEGILAALGQPYMSSKGRPGGGLGLFLVMNVVRKLGGDFSARNMEQGACVTLSLPLAALTDGDDHEG